VVNTFLLSYPLLAGIIKGNLTYKLSKFSMPEKLPILKLKGNLPLVQYVHGVTGESA